MNSSIQVFLEQAERATQQISHALSKSRLYEAAKFARAGHYREAEALLEESGGTRAAGVDTLLLLARIRTQQGRFVEAEKILIRAAEIAPQDTAVHDLLQTVRDVQLAKCVSPMWHAAIPLLMAALIIGIVYLGFSCLSALVKIDESQRNLANLASAILSQQHSHEMASHPQMPVSIVNDALSLSVSNNLANAVEKLSETSAILGAEITNEKQALIVQGQLLSASSNAIQTMALKASTNIVIRTILPNPRPDNYSTNTLVTGAAAATNDVLQPISGLVANIPGIIQAMHQGKMKIFFNDGLFGYGTSFKPGVKDRLRTVIKALAQAKEPIAIEVVGYSDGDQGFFGPLDTYSIGLKRAAVVVDFIRRSGLFSSRELSASSQGAEQLPFPDDSTKGGAKNRTVVLWINVLTKQ